MQNVGIALLVDGHSSIRAFLHHQLVLGLQLYLILRIQVELAVRATLVRLWLLLQAVGAALNVLGVHVRLDHDLVLDLWLLVDSLSLGHLTHVCLMAHQFAVFVTSLIQTRNLRLLHLHFIGRVRVHVYRVLE